MIRFITLAILVMATFSGLRSQYVVQARMDGADTLIVIELPPYTIYDKLPRKLKAQQKKYDKLVHNVKKVYPFAKVAGIKLNEYEILLMNAEESERRRLMKQAEDELRIEFEEDVKKLTFSQGIILIKLVDRETGNSSYELIQELRGNFLAFFWQTFARIFGYNLKIKYDPTGEDKDIEHIVQQIEAGEL